MRYRKKVLNPRLYAALAILLATPLCAFSEPQPDGAAPILQRELTRLAPAASAVVGVAALHIESGRSAFLNPDVGFPMASTKKIAIAVTLLTLVDRGVLSLDTSTPILASQLYSSGKQPLGHYIHAGASLTVQNLLSLMLTVSDNNATDILLKMVGGSAAVKARLKELGIEGQSVNSPASVVIAKLRGRTDVTEANPLTPAEYEKLLKADVPESVLEAQADAYAKGSSDASTPRAMSNLLLAIWNRKALRPESTQVLLTTMYQCELGEGRIKALLPPQTPIAHKTGSAPGTTNDVGIIDLPGNAGHVIVVVFTKAGKPREATLREPVIAQIGRAIYDYFLFVGQPAD